MGTTELIRALRMAGALLFLSGVAGAQTPDRTTDAAARSASARLKPGDQIVLHFLRDHELSKTVTVNERGEAPFPKLGTINVASLSIAQLQDTLRTRYAEYVKSEFEVAVLRRVVVVGEVRMPNVYQVDPAATLRDVIARAGGLTEYGSRGKVYIVRNGVRTKVKGWDGAGESLTTLESGDQVVVGRRNWFAINAISTISTGILVASFVITVAK